MDQKQKNIYLLTSLAALCGLSLFLFFRNTNLSENISPNIFRLSDSKSVNQILLEKGPSKIDLKFSGSRWQLNDTFEADRNLVDVLFATVAQVIPKRMAAQMIRDSVINQINQNGLRISFMVNNTSQQQFYVWGDGNTITYFMKPEEKIPYVMVIPGYKVYVGGIFEQDVNAWRDKRIFNFNWRNFKELRAEFPRDAKQNFNVSLTGKYFSIANEASIDTANLNNYLDAVSLIQADAFYKKGESKKYDSLATSKPAMIITVTDVANQAYQLSVFEVGKNERNALAQWGNDLVWFDRRNILPIYKRRSEFRK